MSPARTAWTIALTALSGPIGAVATGATLARIADATEGGMAGLAAGVGGLFIGGPLLAIVVFTVCAVAIAKPRRPWIAIGVMVVGCLVNGIVAILGLVFVARTEGNEAGLIALAVLSMTVLGVAAWLSLKVASGPRRVEG